MFLSIRKGNRSFSFLLKSLDQERNDHLNMEEPTPFPGPRAGQEFGAMPLWKLLFPFSQLKTPRLRELEWVSPGAQEGHVDLRFDLNCGPYSSPLMAPDRSHRGAGEMRPQVPTGLTW